MLSIVELWLLEYETILVWVGIGSLVFFIASILALPWVLSLIPVNYFLNNHNSFDLKNAKLRQVIFKIIIAILRNIAGVVLIFLGLLMLFLPGQGIITIVAGLFVMDFPAKHKLENKLIENTIVFNTINWFRAKNNHPPLLKPMAKKLKR